MAVATPLRSGEGVSNSLQKDVATPSSGWRMSPYQTDYSVDSSFNGYSPTHTLNDGTPHLGDHVLPSEIFESWPLPVYRIF